MAAVTGLAAGSGAMGVGSEVVTVAPRTVAMASSELGESPDVPSGWDESAEEVGFVTCWGGWMEGGNGAFGLAVGSGAVGVSSGSATDAELAVGSGAMGVGSEVVTVAPMTVAMASSESSESPDVPSGWDKSAQEVWFVLREWAGGCNVALGLAVGWGAVGVGCGLATALAVCLGAVGSRAVTEGRRDGGTELLGTMLGGAPLAHLPMALGWRGELAPGAVAIMLSSSLASWKLIFWSDSSVAPTFLDAATAAIDGLSSRFAQEVPCVT